jgi:hypothetical protein
MLRTVRTAQATMILRYYGPHTASMQGVCAKICSDHLRTSHNGWEELAQGSVR